MAPRNYGHLLTMTARYARGRLDGHTVINRETHAPIALTWKRGLDQIGAPGAPPEILLAVPAIPAMLATAHYLGAAPDRLRRADVARVHGFASAVEIGDWRVEMLMVVRENRAGQLSLDHMEHCRISAARAA
jgi:hypothetical protein